MATVDKRLADELVACDGRYGQDDEDGPADPQVILIVEYDNAHGGVGYGVVYERESPLRYAASEYVRNPRVYWEHKP